MPAKFELIAPCFFGCESTANFELRRIGAEDIRVSDGRLTFRGGADMIAAANLNLRTVERVMLLLARYKVSTFDELFDGVYSIPWEELIPVDAQFPVKGSSLSSQLSSVASAMPGYNLIFAIRHGTGNERKQNTVFADALHRVHHGFIINDFERMVFEWNELSQRYLADFL